MSKKQAWKDYCFKFKFDPLCVRGQARIAASVGSARLCAGVFVIEVTAGYAGSAAVQAVLALLLEVAAGRILEWNQFLFNQYRVFLMSMECVLYHEDQKFLTLPAKF